MQTQETKHEPIEHLSLAKYVRKIAEREPGRWTDDELAIMPREYRRFLQLRRQNPTQALVPTELIDAVWHEHILDTRNYAADMQRIFGAFVHHEPAYDQDAASKDKMDELLHATAQSYEDAFGEPMAGVAARCSGKKCHAPSNCRCR